MTMYTQTVSDIHSKSFIHVFVSIYFWKRVQPSLTYLIQSNISDPYLPKMTNFYLKSLHHTQFAQKSCFHSSSPFCAVISSKATILPKRPNFHLKSTHFLYKPCFHLNSPNFTKVFLLHTYFSQKPYFSPKMSKFPQSPFRALTSTEALFYPSRPFCTLIFLKAPILPKSSIFTQKT